MTTAAQIQSLEQIKQFLTGGHALFTLVLRADGARRTFKVEQAPPKPGDTRDPGFFVRLLVGPDNGSDYQYLGFMYRGSNGRSLFFSPGRNCRHPRVAETFRWFLTQIADGRAENLAKHVEFWHAGLCCKCGRTLTTPESIAAGIGPVCAGRAAAHKVPESTGDTMQSRNDE
jgi:hypothetical protein